MRPQACGAERIVRTGGGAVRTRVAALAIGFSVALCGASTLSAQTVIVTNAAAGAIVEVVRDATVAASAAAGDDGVARVTIPEAAKLQQDIDGLLYVDTCSDRHRVIIQQRGGPLIALDPNCRRREIPGLFLIKPVSTLSIDVAVSPPRLLLRQGRFDPTRPPHLWAEVPMGLTLSGGGGIGSFSGPNATACGNSENCSDNGIGSAFGGGAAFWFKQYLGAEVMYLRPAKWQAKGALENGYSFTSTLDAEALTTSALVGGPVGPTRIYGKVGGSYHRATFSTTETIADKTTTTAGVTQTIKGGTQTLAYRTEGWGLSFGGGLEFWMSRYVAGYSELNVTQLKGKDPNGGEGVSKDRVTTVLAGLKLHLGRH
jgi:hypothetical protein